MDRRLFEINRSAAKFLDSALALALAAAGTALPGCGRSPAPVEIKHSPAPTVQSAALTNARSSFQAITFDKHSNRKKSFLTGDGGSPLPGGRILVQGPRLTTYNDQGTITWVVEAPECVYDEQAESAGSTNQLHVFTVDHRFDIRGVGFQLRLADSHLFISNQVHTLIRKPPSTNATAASEAPLEIFSDQFDYETGLAVYRGHVRADDPEGRLGCELLTARFARPTEGQTATNETRIETIVAERNVVLEQKGLLATGDQAVYAAANNTIEITGHPAWRQGARQGRGERLLVNRATREMNATGSVSMRLPRDPVNPMALFFEPTTAPAPVPGATNQPVKIAADQLDYRPGLALFRGRVQAGDAGGKLSCDLLTVGFAEPGGQVKTLVAERGVAIANLLDGSRATADRAVFTVTNNLLELTGQPRWWTLQQEGRAQRVEVDTLSRRFTADGAVAVKLLNGPTNAPAAFLGLSFVPTNSAAVARGLTQVFSDHLEFSAGAAVFRGQVRAQDPSGTLRCGLMTVTFSAPGNRIQTVVAEHQVDLEQAESQLTCSRLTANAGRLVAEQGVELITQTRSGRGTNLINAIGAKGVYTAAGNLLELTGDPVLMASQLSATGKVLLTSTGEVLVWNRQDRSLRMHGLSHSVVHHRPASLEKPAAAPAEPGRF